MKRLIFLSVFSLLFLKVLPQDTPSQSDTLRKDALNIFMDASDYIRKEIPYPTLRLFVCNVLIL